MNRFFSKLDLRDIKIDPTGSRFPPDGEAVEETEEHTQPDEPQGYLPEDGLTPESFEASPAATAYDGEAEPVFQDAPAAHVEPNHFSNGEAVDTVIGETSDVLKVSAKSRPSAVAGAIAGVVRELGRAEVQAIGAGATNQAVKAVAIARDYLRESGIEAVCLPSFIDVTIDNEDRTAILLVVEPREIAAD